MLRKAFGLFWAVLLLPYALQAGESKAPVKPKKTVKVVITQYVSHAALDAVREGAMDSVNLCSKDKFDVAYDLTNASANTIVARQIAQKHASQEPDVIVAIATLSAQSVLSAVRGKIPIVFGAITDPAAAKVIGKNVTGVTDKPSFKDQIEFVLSLMPDLKKLGILYNPGEDNSRAAVAELLDITKELGLELISVAVSKATDIPQSVSKATQLAEAIFIANDNLVASSFESLVKVANAKKIPVFASDVLLVERGALAMRGIDYYKIGEQAGRQVCQILDGTPVQDIPVSSPADLKLYLNDGASKVTGISFSKELRDSADKIVQQKRP